MCMSVSQLLEESLRLLADVRCASDATREMLARLVAPFVARFHTLGGNNHATGTGGNGSSSGATDSQAESKVAATSPMVVMDIGDATLASTGEAAAAAAQLDEDIKVIQFCTEKQTPYMFFVKNLFFPLTLHTPSSILS